MAPSETIGDMYTCFTDVVNSLKTLGKYFSNFELINKILRSLPKKAKDLNNFSLEELIMGYDELENHLPKNMKDLTLRTIEDHSKKALIGETSFCAVRQVSNFIIAIFAS
ncbi:hypothetical protein MUK42_22162 [Musa troglodytarum]|uniref:Uncharacterized protein n=1 Tax=Musa troglodytarum TaxID=320322 RepID=A0A9E7KDW7_9LILI|nr:hypothetical protein MUK42_22162 [Musa troglodytarum]